MITQRSVYQEGFLDGARNCGFILTDTTDEELHLKGDWVVAIEKGFLKRNYDEREAHSTEMMHKFLTDITKENAEQKKKIEELRELLKIANSRV